MKYLATLLLIFGFGLSGFGQTIKTLGYNTTNGHIIYSGTNTLTFPSVSINGIQINGSTVSAWGRSVDLDQGILDGEWEFNNAVGFGTPNNTAITRANLGLGWSALTNTNASTSLLGFTTNGQVVANTGTNTLEFTNSVNFGADFSLASPSAEFQWGGITFFEPETKIWFSAFSFNNTTNAATTRANLGFSTNLNTLWNATSALTARQALEISTNDSVYFGGVYAPTASFSDGNFVNATFDNEVEFANGFSFGLYSNTSSAIARTNLMLGSSWLTNTNVTNFRSAIGLGATNIVDFFQVYANLSVDVGTGSNYVGLRTDSIVFGNPTIVATTRTNLGLGGGITTNRTFVSYNGTNYTTNTVTISNGIITGWTQ